MKKWIEAIKLVLNAVLGIALPLAYFEQVESLLKSMPVFSLVPAYGTEWLLYCIAGLSAGFVLLAAEATVMRLRGRNDLPGKPLFVLIAVASLLFALSGWLAVGGIVIPRPVWLLSFVLTSTMWIAAFRWRFVTEALDRVINLSRWVTWLGALTMLSLPLPRFSSGATAKPPMRAAQGAPSVVIVTFDALAASHLGVYGYSRNTSPNLDAFARQAVVFTRFHAASNFTTSSVASLLTATLPWEHRALQLYGVPLERPASQSLPATLRDMGYETAYVGSNPLGGARRQGFGGQFDLMSFGPDWQFGFCIEAALGLLPYLCEASENPVLKPIYARIMAFADRVGIVDSATYSDPREVVVRATQVLQQKHDRPFFLWVHFLRPHDPYLTPAPWLGRFAGSSADRSYSASAADYGFSFGRRSPERRQLLEARYDEAIAYADGAFALLRNEIERTLGKNVVLAVTADHGESFAHGYGAHAGPMLYEDMIRIPLLVSTPAGVVQPGFDDRLASQIDIAPTIAALAGIPGRQGWRGSPLLGEAVRREETAVFAMNFEENTCCARLRTGSVTVLNGHWKRVRYLGVHAYQGTTLPNSQLFDLDSDPGELRDLSSVYPDKAAELDALISAQMKVNGGRMVRQ